jgi:hypothetical protein
MTNLDAILHELKVAPCYRGLLERMVAAAGARAGDLAQTFFCELIAARERDLPQPEALALAAARRWLKRERIDASRLAPLVLTGDDGKERERPLRPLPAPAPAVRRQLRWGRRADTLSISVAPHSDLREAVRRLPMPERRAVASIYGVGGPKRRGRRSRELLALAERGVARLREVLPQEHFVAEMF